MGATENLADIHVDFWKYWYPTTEQQPQDGNGQPQQGQPQQGRPQQGKPQPGQGQPQGEPQPGDIQDEAGEPQSSDQPAEAPTDFWEKMWEKNPEPQQVTQTGKKPGDAPYRPPKVNVNDDDVAEARRQVRKIARTLISRMSHQRKKTRKHKQIDLRKTMHKAKSTGGIPIDIKFKARPVKKTKLIAILDVSGSMEEYDAMLIQLLQAIRMELSSFEMFVFANDLERVTPLVAKDFHQTMANIEQVGQWNRGTDILRSLQTLQGDFSKLLNRNSVIIFLSDLESYDNEASALEIAEIQRKVKRFYIFDVVDLSVYKTREDYKRFHYKGCVEPFEGVADGIFFTRTLEDMSQAVKKVCLK